MGQAAFVRVTAYGSACEFTVPAISRCKAARGASANRRGAGVGQPPGRRRCLPDVPPADVDVLYQLRCRVVEGLDTSLVQRADALLDRDQARL